MKSKNTNLIKLLIKSDVFLRACKGTSTHPVLSVVEMNSIIKQYFAVTRYFRKVRTDSSVFFLLVDNQYLQGVLTEYFISEGVKNVRVCTNPPSSISTPGNVLSSFMDSNDKNTGLLVKKLFYKNIFISVQKKNYGFNCSNGSYSIYVNFSSLKSLIFFCCILKRELK